MKYLFVSLFCLFIGNLQAQDSYWNKYADTEWTPAATDYKIASAAQLAQLALLVNQGNTFEGVTFTLTTDIDLSAHYWVPIAEENTLSFCGVFDGGKHTIKGLRINNNSTDYRGVYSALFGRIGGGCEIRDILLEEGDIQGGMGDGTLTASLVADIQMNEGGKDIKIQDCHNLGVTVTAGSGARGGRTGGLIASVLINPEDGNGVNVYITGCSSIVSVSSISTSNSTGGLIGWISLTGSKSRLAVVECIGSEDIVNSKDYTGGLIGRVQALGGSSFTLRNGFFKGQVISDEGYTGGLVGRLTAREESQATVTGCAVTILKLKGGKANTNEIVGRNDNGILTDNQIYHNITRD